MSSNPLDQLRPIIHPTYGVSVWPLAPGWWILIIFVVVMFVAIMLLRPMFKLRKQQKKIQTHTQQLLNALFEDCKKQPDTSLALQAYLQGSNDIFKRVIHGNPCLSQFSHLVGNHWTAFISRIDPESSFATLYGNNLYAPRCKEKINLEELHHWATAWVLLASKKPRKEISP
jgi:hypothetical protein